MKLEIYAEHPYVRKSSRAHWVYFQAGNYKIPRRMFLYKARVGLREWGWYIFSKNLHWFRKSVQLGCYRIVPVITGLETPEEYKPELMQQLSYIAAALHRYVPDNPTWIIHPSGETDPLWKDASIGVKCNCERLPWHKGWFDMIKARIWLWRHHVAI